MFRCESRRLQQSVPQIGVERTAHQCRGQRRVGPRRQAAELVCAVGKTQFPGSVEGAIVEKGANPGPVVLYLAQEDVGAGVPNPL
jgi:hypothetical protein